MCRSSCEFFLPNCPGCNFQYKRQTEEGRGGGKEENKESKGKLIKIVLCKWEGDQVFQGVGRKSEG